MLQYKVSYFFMKDLKTIPSIGNYPNHIDVKCFLKSIPGNFKNVIPPTFLMSPIII